MRARIKTNLQTSSRIYFEREKGLYPQYRVSSLLDKPRVKKSVVSLAKFNEKLKEKAKEIADGARYCIKRLPDGSRGIYIISKRGNLVSCLE